MSSTESALPTSRSGRQLKDSDRKKQAKETQEVEESKSFKRKRADKDKENRNDLKGKAKVQQFNITLLPTNQTALKGTPINLQARKPGLPRPKAQTELISRSVQPAALTAGHRHNQPSSTPSIRKLTTEKAAQLAALKNPFGSPPTGRNGHPNGMERGKATATPAPSRRPTSQTASSSKTVTLPRTAGIMPTLSQATSSHRSRGTPNIPHHQTFTSSMQTANATASTSARTVEDRRFDPDEGHFETDDAGMEPNDTEIGVIDAEHMSHYEVSKLGPLNLDDTRSEEDEEQGIPRESWIPSHLRQLAQLAVSRLNVDYAGDDDDMDQAYVFDGDHGSDNDQDIPHPPADRPNNHVVDKDEHEGEFDDAPEIQEEDYDSDVPLAKCRRGRDEPPVDLRAGHRKAARIREREEGKRPRVADYEPDARHILLQAISIFKSLISSQDAYADKLTEMTWAKQSWWEAAEKLDIELAPNRECIKIITAYSWHLRGEVKTVARSLVETAYRFRVSGQTEIQLRNREKVAKLRKNDAFVYRKRGETVDDHEGLYQADIIQQMANHIYFKSKKDDGVVLRDRYSPFPVVALALILAAVECAIDEWTDGSFTKVLFTEDKYLPVYRHHLRELRQYEAASDDLHVVTQLCKWIYEDGRIYAKAGPDESLVTRSLGPKAYAKGISDFKRYGRHLDGDGSESADEDN